MHKMPKIQIVQGEIRGTAQGDELRSFFATVGADGQSRTKISIKAALAVIYFWAKDISMGQTKILVGGEVDSKSDNTVIDWRNLYSGSVSASFERRAVLVKSFKSMRV